MQDEAVDLIASFEVSTEALIRLLLVRIYAFFETAEMRTIFRIISTEGPYNPALAEMYHRQVISRGRPALRRLMARGIARGEIAPGPLADQPEIIVAPVLMALVWRQTFGEIDPIPGQAFHAAHIELLLSGLIRRPEPEPSFQVTYP